MEVKGTALLANINFVRKRFGEEAFSKWMQGLSAEAQEIIGGHVLPTKWYAAGPALIEPLQLICDTFFSGDARGAREVGRFSADQSLRGVYRIFVKIGSPGMTVDRGVRLFEQYYRPGRVVDISRGDGRIVRQIHGFTDRSGLIEQRLVGFIERAMEISSAKNVRIEVTKSLAAGDDCIEFDVRWA